MSENSLVNGYRVIEGEIISDFSGKRIKDVPVRRLKLSEGAWTTLCNALFQNDRGKGIRVSELLSMSSLTLLLLDGMELTMASEIISALKEYLQAEDRQKSHSDSGSLRQNAQPVLPADGLNKVTTNAKPKQSEGTKTSKPIKADTPKPLSLTEMENIILAEENDAEDDFIVHKATGIIIPNGSIEKLNLSVRAYNCLMRDKRGTISDLVGLSFGDLMKIRHMAKLSANEVKAKLEEYLVAQIRQNDLQVKMEEVVPQNSDEERNLSEIQLIPDERFSRMNPDIPVLAPEYFVSNTIIVHKETGKLVQDASINALDLSVRAYNCLMRGKFTTISSLVGLPFSELLGIKNMGIQSANEVQEKLEQYLNEASGMGQAQFAPVRKVVTQADVLRCFKEQAQFAPVRKAVTAADVLRCFEDAPFLVLSFDNMFASIIDTSPDAREDEVWEMIANLVVDNKLTCVDDKTRLYQRVYPSFWAKLEEQNPDDERKERLLYVLRMRAEGKSLEEVGQTMGITRERVRQIEKKAYDKITKKETVFFAEDKYAHLFSEYSLDKSFFFEYLEETEQTWRYLNLRYTKGKKDLEQAKEDEALPVSVRRAVESYVLRDYMQIDGEYVRMQRSDMEDYVLKHYCKETVTLEEFFALYNNFLQEHGIADEALLATGSVRATRSNRLSESTKLLWKQNRKLRYYDIDNGEYTELLETLNLGQYKDVEISTLKFMEEFPKLMQQYDLRDEYEVHNLLKKIHAEKENPTLVFNRMPHLQFGTFDRDAAVKEIMFALAPVSQDDLAEMIYLEYGARLETVKANWLTCVAEYYHQGMYTVDCAVMPEEQAALLKEALTEDFYYFTELRAIYTKLIPNGDVSLLSPYNLKKMGFLVGTSYVIQHYPTAEAYFRHLLLDKDIVNVKGISERYGSLTTYSAFLNELKRELEIIEFEPYQYINIRRLEKLGYDKKRLRKYGDRVWSYLTEENFFTIQSLRNMGFEDELDVFGFEDTFYTSLLKWDDRFSYQRFGNGVLFSAGGKPFGIQDFLVELIQKARAIDVDDFLEEIKERYGIVCDRWKVLEKIKGSSVHYDSIMQRLYDDYETYFDEI